MTRTSTGATRAALAALVLATVAGGVVAVAGPAGAATVPAGAVAGSGFLARELTRLGGTYPSPTSPGNADGGLTADAILALTTTGGQDATATAATSALRKAYFNANLVVSGTVAKYLLVAEREDVDPRAWGKDSAGKDVDLVARLESTRNAAGRFTNTGAPSDLSNVFSQSFALVALHEWYADHGGGSAADERTAVAYLVRQQCPSGGFRPAPPDGKDTSTCTAADDANVSVDYTATAVWALASLGVAPDAVGKAVGWLTARQDAGGGFGAVSTSAGTIRDTLNANSTGLAAQALAAAGSTSAASRANGWLTGLQLPASVRPAAMVGALAYGPGDLSQIHADPSGYWGRSSNQDKLRRATAQAVVGLAAAPPSGGSKPPSGGGPGGPGDGPSKQPSHRPGGSTSGAGAGPTGGARPGPTMVPSGGPATGGGPPPSRTPSATPSPSTSTTAAAVPTASSSPTARTVADVQATPTGWRAFVGGPGGLTCAVLLGLALAVVTYRRFSRAGAS